MSKYRYFEHSDLKQNWCSPTHHIFELNKCVKYTRTAYWDYRYSDLKKNLCFLLIYQFDFFLLDVHILSGLKFRTIYEIHLRRQLFGNLGHSDFKSFSCLILTHHYETLSLLEFHVFRGSEYLGGRADG